MINEISYIGYFFLILAMLNSFLLVSSKTIFYKIDIQHERLISFTSRIHFPILFLSFLCLIYSFLIDDFSVKYISDNSNSALPFFYKISAVWAGHEGSMLLWCLILSFWMFLASKYSKSLETEFRQNYEQELNEYASEITSRKCNIVISPDYDEIKIGVDK